MTLAAKTIVKLNNQPLVAGDIAGAGHWLELQYDSVLDKYVLQNPNPSSLLSVANLTSKLQPLLATVSANAVNITLNPTTLDFRSNTLASGAVATRTVNPAITLTVPNGAVLGTISNIASRIIILAIDNAGTVELAVINAAANVNLDESNLISTVAISAGSAAFNVAYSTTARTNVPFRVIGYFESTQTTAGTWAASPSKVQGAGGLSVAGLNSIGSNQSWTDMLNPTVQRASGTLYYNTTGKPIEVSAVGRTSTIAIGSVNAVVNGVQAGYSGISNANGNQYPSVNFIVQAGMSYQVNFFGSAVLDSWTELR